MNLSATVAEHLRSFAGANVLGLLTDLSRLDRYPASDGLDQAAALVADHAERMDLQDVRVEHWTVDGEPRRWWSYGAPASWTPRAAWLRHAGRNVVEYPADALGLALNSTSVAPSRYPLRRQDEPGVAGAVVVVTDPSPGEALWTDLVRRGATAAVCSPCHDSAPGPISRRVELRSRTELAVFSVPSATLRHLLEIVGDDVEVGVDTRQGARMPVFTCVVPGSSDGSKGSEATEIVLHAHLDHPRPSANDNASGVVAVLEVARMLRAWPSAHPIRVICGPEFSGSAAWLHDRVAAGLEPQIGAVFNLDTVGIDSTRAGAPLAVERAPSGRPSVASSMLRLALSALPPRARSYGGAVPTPALHWYATPFVGASDHLVFGDSDPDRTVTALSQHPDPMRHTSGDTADRVSARQLALVCAATAAAAGTLATSEGAATLRRAVLAAANHDLGAGVQKVLAGNVSAMLPGSVDPQDPAWALAGVAAVEAAASRDLDWIETWAQSSCTSTAVGPLGEPHARRALAAAGEGARRSLSALPTSRPPRRAKGARHAQQAEPANRLHRAWAGPFSLIDALAELPEQVRERCWDDIARDRGAAYARLVALALSVDGTRRTPGVVEAAALSCGTAIHVEDALAYLRGLRDAGWLREEPACT